MAEKSAHGAHGTEVQQVEGGEEMHYDLTELSTLGVDVENRDAVKGDASDGKIGWTWTQIAATVSLAGLYVGVYSALSLESGFVADDAREGAQMPIYFVGGCLSFITNDLGGAGKSVWLPVSNTLAIASVAPFTGYLQDIFGRRYIAITGALCIMVGVVIVGTAHTFAQAVLGMAIAGAGAAITELTALAGYYPPPPSLMCSIAKRLQVPPSLCLSTDVACIWVWSPDLSYPSRLTSCSLNF